MRKILFQNRALRAYVESLSGLIAYYPLNEIDGAVAYNCAPSTIGSYNGTITGAAVGQDGKVGKSYSFDGVGDGVVMTGFNPTSSSLSVGLMFKLNGTPDANDRIVDCTDSGPANGFSFELANTPSLNLFIRNNTTTVATANSGTLSDNTWYIAVMTYSVNSAKFFINGSQVGTTDTSCTMAEASQNLTLGKRSASAANYFTGYIQHFFVCNQVITPVQVLKIAQLARLA